MVTYERRSLYSQTFQGAPSGLYSSACLGEVSTYGRLKVGCLYVAITMTECLLRRGVHLWEVKNTVFVCGWDLD